MVQQSSIDGFATDWHLVHMGSRAVGGVGLAMMEAAAVEPDGRISINDLGIWKEEHIPGLRRIVEFVHSEGAAAGIQLGHGGRKSSLAPNFDKNGIKPLKHLTAEQGAWAVIGPSPIPYGHDYPSPHPMTRDDISRVRSAYRAGALRAHEAGFDWIELHAAHG